MTLIKKEYAALCVAAAVLLIVGGAYAQAEPARGEKMFGGACAACHSIEPGEHLTGPSLSGVVGRKAGSAEKFHRYSDALRKSGAVWNDGALDAWLRDPAAFVPGTAMNFRGIPDAAARADVIAYLKTISSAKTAGTAPRASRLPDLKIAPPGSRVSALRHCGDAYYVTTGGNVQITFWEFNLRFKTDSSSRGPARGQPVLVGQGMVGDRAQIVFSDPGEISTFIKTQCK